MPSKTERVLYVAHSDTWVQSLEVRGEIVEEFNWALEEDIEEIKGPPTTGIWVFECEPEHADGETYFRNPRWRLPRPDDEWNERWDLYRGFRDSQGRGSELVRSEAIAVAEQHLAEIARVAEENKRCRRALNLWACLAIHIAKTFGEHVWLHAGDVTPKALQDLQHEPDDDGSNRLTARDLITLLAEAEGLKPMVTTNLDNTKEKTNE